MKTKLLSYDFTPTHQSLKKNKGVLLGEKGGGTPWGGGTPFPNALQSYHLKKWEGVFRGGATLLPPQCHTNTITKNKNSEIIPRGGNSVTP